MPSKRDADRTSAAERIAAGADERAATKLRIIAREREKAQRLDRDDPLPAKDGVPQYRWPRPPEESDPPDYRHLVTTARARAAAGVLLSADDHIALVRYPNPTPYEVEFRAAAERYRSELDAHGRPL